MIYTETELDGYAFCVNVLPVPGSRRRVKCEGYEMAPVTLVLERRTVLFGDSGPSSDVIDSMMAGQASHVVENLRFRDVERDVVCPHCHERTRHPSLEAEHVQYENLSLRDPDELLNVDQLRLEAATRAERQAAEQLEEDRRGNDIAERRLALEEKRFEWERAQRNGHAEPDDDAISGDLSSADAEVAQDTGSGRATRSAATRTRPARRTEG